MDHLTEPLSMSSSAPSVSGPPLALVWKLELPELHDWNVKLASLEKQFRPAQVAQYARGRHVYSVNRSYRDSLELPSRYFSKPAEQILSLLRSGRSQFEQTLVGEACTWSDVSMKYLSYGDGGLFKLHRDILRMPREERMLTFVYFMHLEPRGFTGGELEFVGDDGRSLVVDPMGGSLVIFNSKTLHGVRPVVCTSERFLDKRLVLCGFICRRRTLAKQAKVWMGVLSKAALRRVLRYTRQRSRG